MQSTNDRQRCIMSILLVCKTRHLNFSSLSFAAFQSEFPQRKSESLALKIQVKSESGNVIRRCVLFHIEDREETSTKVCF